MELRAGEERPPAPGDPDGSVAHGAHVRELDLPGGVRLPTDPAISVVVTVTERPMPLAELYREYSRPLRELDGGFEFIFAVESFNRELVAPLRELALRGEPIRVVEAGHTVGESTLLKVGAALARGKVLLTMPAYPRVEAETLPALVRAVEAGADMATARRWPRRDSLINRTQTRLFHSLMSSISGPRLHDVASGVRAMRPHLLREVPLYGDFFRFLPILVLREGFEVVEVEAAQHPGDAETRLYSPGTYLRRVIDVVGLVFLARFTYKPLRFFGLIGSIIGGLGALMLLVLFGQRLAGQGLADRPVLLLAVLLFTLGAQAIALGLIGEIIVHFNAPARRPYRVREGNGAPGADAAETISPDGPRRGAKTG